MSEEGLVGFMIRFALQFCNLFCEMWFKPGGIGMGKIFVFAFAYPHAG